MGHGSHHSLCQLLQRMSRVGQIVLRILQNQAEYTALRHDCKTSIFTCQIWHIYRLKSTIRCPARVATSWLAWWLLVKTAAKDIVLLCLTWQRIAREQSCYSCVPSSLLHLWFWIIGGYIWTTFRTIFANFDWPSNCRINRNGTVTIFRQKHYFLDRRIRFLPSIMIANGVPVAGSRSLNLYLSKSQKMTVLI